MDEIKIREIRKLSPARKLIAKRMLASLRDYPQGTLSTKIVMDEVINLRNNLVKYNNSITFTSILAKLAAEALIESPELNSKVVDNEITIYESINMGVAVGLQEALMVVVVKNIQDKNIYQVSDELQNMIAKLKNKKLDLSDMKGSTFTFTNMGMYDIDVMTPVLNPPESAILAVGKTRKEMVVGSDNETRIESRATFSLTANHAAADGIHIGSYLIALREALKDPYKHMGL